MNHILIIEDDLDIRESLTLLLESENFNVTTASDGIEGLKLFSEDISLVILDIMLPGLSGFKVCEEIRKISFVPILILSAKSDILDIREGLSLGADDYIAKPFSTVELLARINSLLRRCKEYTASFKNEPEIDKRDLSEWICRFDITLNRSKNEVYLKEEALHLTDIEYNILSLFFNSPGKTFSIQELYEIIWQEPFLPASANTVMVHIKRLRSKIEKDPKNPNILCNVWGKGYRLGK